LEGGGRGLFIGTTQEFACK